MTTGAEQPNTRDWLNGRMSALENSSKETDGESGTEPGRVSKVTLGLLLRMHLQDGERLALTFGCQVLARATDGLSLQGLAYERAELTCSVLAQRIATAEMWLTQCATVEGYLTGAGASVREVLWYRMKRREILFTSDLGEVIDAGVFTIRRERARELTRWALGDGKFSYAMSLPTMWQLLYKRETKLMNGWQHT